MKTKTKAKTPKRPKKPPVELLPRGTVLAEFTLNERAVPWKAPTITRNGGHFKDETLVMWQQLVFVTAMNSRTVKKPYEGPVEIRIVLSFEKGPVPDCSNAAKAVEDAMQGAVYVNDRKTVYISTERTNEKEDRVYVLVTAA